MDFPAIRLKIPDTTLFVSLFLGSSTVFGTREVLWELTENPMYPYSDVYSI